ncbi:MAG: DUF4832 domain-containing protein [Candidatus Sumerlaeia bacterium]|nr:DUF4832 domain-containing protein [Candidatus Sumerlaeia bacterium]
MKTAAEKTALTETGRKTAAAFSMRFPHRTVEYSRKRICIGLVWIIAQAAAAQPVGDVLIRDGWVTVRPMEFRGALNNPLKGFRAYKKNGYGLLERKYIKWNEIEVCADDTVERIIAHTNRITVVQGKRFEALNVKLVPRVYLDWNGTSGKQYWPADLHTFDYDSPAFQQRLRRLVEKLGLAWDEDPRIFAVQMGLIGYWGEHHNPAPTAAQRRLLTDAFQKAFKNKPVLVRHTDPEFMQAGFGIYYDTFGTLTREPPTQWQEQFPHQATYVYRDIWKRAPIEGEVEYNWQQRDSAKPQETFGRTPDETMKVPAYRRYMIDKIRRYHASYLGWISGYTDTDAEVLAGAAELQQAFGYRYVLEAAAYPLTVQPGQTLTVKLTVRNTGSAPFYLDWPVAVGLLDPATRKPVWSAPLEGVDIRKWLPGEDWDSGAFAYRRPAVPYHDEGRAVMPQHIKPGQYILGLAMLDRQGGMMPSARFAIVNYFRGGWHPLGFIGVGEAPKEVALKHIEFDSPAFDDSLHYKVPEKLLAVKTPPVPPVKAVVPWTADPRVELINPWRYWTLRGENAGLEKQILHEDRRIIRAAGDFGKGASLDYTFGEGVKLDPGRYRFAFRVRGTPGLSVTFDLADGWRSLSKLIQIPLSGEWHEHTIEFEVKTTFKDETTLRFDLPQNTKGTFDLTDTRLKRVD